MHAMVRHYSGENATELMDLLVSRRREVEALMREVKGLISYDLVTTSGGGFSVTVCRDRAGAEDSLKRAKDWLKAHAKDLGMSVDVIEGDVHLHVVPAKAETAVG